MSVEEEEKSRMEYEKHRQEVEPKMAATDDSFTFEHPGEKASVSIPNPLYVVIGEDGAQF